VWGLGCQEGLPLRECGDVGSDKACSQGHQKPHAHHHHKRCHQKEGLVLAPFLAALAADALESAAAPAAAAVAAAMAASAAAPAAAAAVAAAAAASVYAAPAARRAEKQ
jgi:hypothetical protein